jgi:hypothetical protein
MQQAIRLRTTQLEGYWSEDHPGWVRRLGDRRRWLGRRLGALGGAAVDRYKPPAPGARGEVGRHRTMTTIDAVQAPEESLLPLAEVTDRLRIHGQHYEGVQTIPVARIIGTVDRSVDFDRLFRPRRMLLRSRLEALGEAFPDGMVPAIAAYEVGGMYFVVDGHHRVALAHQLQMDYIEADVTSITTSYALTPDVDVRQLIHTEQHRMFKERSRLLVRHPEAKILFSRPSGYGQILDLVEAHAYQMSVRAGQLVPLEEATADWYETDYRPATAAIHQAKLPKVYRHATKADIYLWVEAKRRELRTTDRTTTWTDAAMAAGRDGVHRREQRTFKRERRRPLHRRIQPALLRTSSQSGGPDTAHSPVDGGR